MDHSVLTILDLGIIAAYLVIMVLVGVYSVRRIQNTKDYYVAGRSFGPMVLMATVCATIIGGSGLMGRAGVAYTDGFKAVLTAIPYLLNEPLSKCPSGNVHFLRHRREDLGYRDAVRDHLYPGAV